MVLPIMVALLLSGGCSAGAGTEASAAKVVSAVGLRLQRNDLNPAELTRARTWAKGYVRSLVAAHTELAGLEAEGLYPVFDEAKPVPIGAMVRLGLPHTVPAVDLELIRSRGEVPERVLSHVVNLRSLDAIYEFKDGAVTFLGVSPQGNDMSEPAGETVVRPVKPEQHRDPNFSEGE